MALIEERCRSGGGGQRLVASARVKQPGLVVARTPGLVVARTAPRLVNQNNIDSGTIHTIRFYLIPIRFVGVY